MTQEEKRIKIAGACGWTDCHKSVAALVGFPTERKAVGIPPNRITYATIPDYFNDLNACHEMEKTLTDAQFDAFQIALSRIVFNHPCAVTYPVGFKVRKFWNAKPAQRAQAFGLTMGLWKEGE